MAPLPTSAPRTEATTSRGRVPTGLTVAAFALCVVGLAAALYLAYEHATGSTSLACPDTGRINCAKVTTSAYSTFLGVPVAYLGVAFFLVMAALTSPPVWTTDRPALARIRLAVAAGGVVFALWLVYAELYLVGSVCLWCTSVHVITVLLFGVLVFGEALRE